MRIFVFTAFFLLLLFSVSESETVLLRFDNRSDFKKPWDLADDMPEYLSKCLDSAGFKMNPYKRASRYLKDNLVSAGDYHSKDKLREIAHDLSSSKILYAVIDEFYIGKNQVDLKAYVHSGYEHYRASLEGTLFLFDTNSDSLFLKPFKVSEVRHKGRAVFITDLSEENKKYISLEKEKFGSEIFKKTVAGDAMNELCKKIIAFIVESVGNKEIIANKENSGYSASVFVRDAVVLDVQDSAVFINSGSRDNIAPGEVFGLFEKGDPLKDPETGEVLGYSEKEAGKIKVELVKAAGFSRCRLISGKAEKGMTVRIKVDKKN
ncbi:MAG: hypothetical protein ACLFQK_00715 [Fibrobacterota bacterium]